MREWEVYLFKDVPQGNSSEVTVNRQQFNFPHRDIGQLSKLIFLSHEVQIPEHVDEIIAVTRELEVSQ